jgi:hypothetical protein
MVFNLSAVGSAQADDTSQRTAVHKSNEIPNPRLRCERNHSAFAIFKSPIDPDQRHIPIQMGCQRQRQTMFDQIRGVFIGIKSMSINLM